MRSFREVVAATIRKTVSLLAIGGIGAGLGAIPFAAQGRPLVPAEKRYDYYSGRLPACGDPSVLERIQSRFHDRESEFWKSGLDIAGFDAVREVGMRSHGLDYIPRRYCVARAQFNDRSARSVSYTIVEGEGMIGFGFGVDWCVAGLDRNYAAAPNCQLDRP
ncbi:MAG: hypothetical protein ACLP8A_08340 [Methylovirgula sp.]